MSPTRKLFLEDAYLSAAEGKVVAINDLDAIVLDQTNFYATSGGQPGDSGRLSWNGGEIEIATAVKGEGDDIVGVVIGDHRCRRDGNTEGQGSAEPAPVRGGCRHAGS